jgi:hypothetical protein
MAQKPTAEALFGVLGLMHGTHAGHRQCAHRDSVGLKRCGLVALRHLVVRAHAALGRATAALPRIVSHANEIVWQP